MRLLSMLVLLPCLSCLGTAPARAADARAPEPKTVCTVTVNSPDEKEAFARHLPEGRYRFVELVERGRPDWLASACRAKVSCDILIVSGHYDGGNEFFSDQLDVQEFLPVSELERVSCSGSCPTLFSRLKEVYLFGCNTLNPEPQSGASAEIVRSLVREGHTREQAERELESLVAAHGESSRDRMRQIFPGVPVIYGFSSTAPLGPTAGSVLERYFRSAGDREIAGGRASSRLLGAFSAFGLSSTQGLQPKDPQRAARADMCQFADERSSAATKLAFVHALLQRHVGEARLYLDRIQRLMASLDAATRASPAVAQVLEQIARDQSAREQLLDYARDADQPAVRVRLVNLARDVGWLSAAQRRDELVQMLRQLQGEVALGVPEVNLACTLNDDHALDGAYNLAIAPGSLADDVAHAAVRACMGSAEDRARTLRALQSPHENDVRVAQAYVRHRPLTDEADLRAVADGIAAMPPGDAQVRALEALGRHYLADRTVLDRLIQLFADTPSAAVQRAIAGILIRADKRALAAEPLTRLLREHRHAAPPGGEDLIDVLIAVLRSR
ncbi:MAG: hypothetical protein U1E89_16365 [Burkholderiaceae bacterium]